MSTVSERWVAPRLTDGLGNRLFQLVTASQAAKLWGKQLVFAMPKTLPACHGSWETIFQMFPQIPKVWDLSGSSYFDLSQKNCFHYYNLPSTDPNSRTIIRGLPIAAKCVDKDFLPSWSSVVSNPVELLKKWNLETEEKRLQTVFLHIRLGDYLKLPHHQVPLLSYYARSISQFTGDVHYLVFSDEPERARQFPLFDYSFTFVDEPDEGRALFLMAHCWRGAITANSTFSWWGAYFGHVMKPELHTTCMPAKWMASDEDTSGVYPPWAHPIRVD